MSFFKKEIFKAREQAIPMCRKTRRQGSRAAWLNRELWLEVRGGGKKESLPALQDGAADSRGLQCRGGR